MCSVRILGLYFKIKNKTLAGVFLDLWHALVKEVATIVKEELVKVR